MEHNIDIDGRDKYLLDTSRYIGFTRKIGCYEYKP